MEGDTQRNGHAWTTTRMPWFPLGFSRATKSSHRFDAMQIRHHRQDRTSAWRTTTRTRTDETNRTRHPGAGSAAPPLMSALRRGCRQAGSRPGAITQFLGM